MGHISTSKFSSSLPFQQGLTLLDVARDQGHSDICEDPEKYLTTETKEIQYQEPESEIQKPDSEEYLTTESQEATQQSHSETTKPDSEQPLMIESQEAPQQSHSETTGPDSETLKSPPGVEETTPKGVLPEIESNRSKVGLYDNRSYTELHVCHKDINRFPHYNLQCFQCLSLCLCH